jgi:DNA-binding GntR family transcriptional regulator
MVDISSIRLSASRVAVDRIREAILDGRLEAGARLKEDELAQRLKTCRTPIREALGILDSEGLVVNEGRRGATVRAYTVGELDDIYSLRALLEGFAARQAAVHISEQELRVLAESSERFSVLCRKRNPDARDLAEENARFHGTILKAARNPRLATMVTNVIQLPLVYKAYIWFSPSQKRLSHHAHEKIARALERRDGDRAELVMRDHVLEARDYLIATMEAQEKSGG